MLEDFSSSNVSLSEIYDNARTLSLLTRFDLCQRGVKEFTRALP